MSKTTRSNIEEILLQRRNIVGECWLYTGHKVKGYGRISYLGKDERVHRLAAMIWLGYDLNDDLHEICHERNCPNKACFRPEHIRMDTRSGNVQDSIALGTFVKPNNRNEEKTHCKYGHEYTPENTRLNRGHRYCRECERIRDRKRWEATRNSAKPLNL